MDANAGFYLQDGEFVAEKQQKQPLDPQTAITGMAGNLATRDTSWTLTSFFNLLPNPDPILKAMGNDVRVYRDLKAEAIMKGLIARREGAVKSMERGFDRGQSRSRVAKALEGIFAQLDHHRLIEEGLDGAFMGYRVFEVVWDRVDGLIVPVDLVGKPSEWFGFDKTGQLLFRSRAAPQGQPVPDRKFIVVGKKRTYENPYGDADLAACFWPVTFKRGGLKFWVRFTEKYGMPWSVGKLPRQASQAETDSLADKLYAMVQDAVAVVPDDASVELMTVATTANADLYDRLLMFCRSEVSIAMLGNNQTVEMQSNKASSEAGQQIERFIREADAQMIAAGYNRLVRWINELNWNATDLPTWEFWEQEQVDETLARRDQILSQAGVRFTSQYFQREYKLEPGDIQSVVAAAAAPDGTSAAADSGPAFAEPGAPALPQDQLALDDAIAQLPGGLIQAAMKKLLGPALAAIADASTPDEVLTALAEAWPEMDAGELQQLMERAYFVADLQGRTSPTAT